jgi:aspartokinase/homoserine dehydrogenase 1
MDGVRRRVIKFGGTSVGSAERLASSLGIVEARARKRPVLVVTSALAGVTDALLAAILGARAGRLAVQAFIGSLRGRHLALLRAVATGADAGRAEAALETRLGELEDGLRSVAARRLASPAERDALVASGERLAAPILAAALRSRGLDARAIDASALVRTDRTFGDAVVDFQATRQLVESTLGGLPAEAVPVVTGFLGATEDGDTTTLGRDGSDYSAAILGWALEADCVEIWSDVDGVMSADPRMVPTAVLLPRLSWREAAALAEGGARVLHPRTIAPLEEAGIPAIIANALRPRVPGTRVAAEPGLSRGRATAVTSRLRAAEAEVVVLGAIARRGAERASRALSAAGVSPRALSPSENPPSLRALVAAAERETALRALHDAFALPVAG